MEAHGGAGNGLEQAKVSCRLRLRLFFLEMLFVLHRYACRLTDLIGCTLLSPTSMRCSILTTTKPNISYLDREKIPSSGRTGWSFASRSWAWIGFFWIEKTVAWSDITHVRLWMIIGRYTMSWCG